MVKKEGYKKKIIIAVCFILLAVVFGYLSYSKNCKSDEGCFMARASKCSPAVVEVSSGVDTYIYEIAGSRRENCVVKVVMVEPSLDLDLAVRNALRGKSMVCEAPREILAGTPVSEIKDFSSYCSGPLKEVLLKITLDQLYELVTEKIGGISLKYIDIVEDLNNEL